MTLSDRIRERIARALWRAVDALTRSAKRVEPKNHGVWVTYPYTRDVRGLGTITLTSGWLGRSGGGQPWIGTFSEAVEIARDNPSRCEPRRFTPGPLAIIEHRQGKGAPS